LAHRPFAIIVLRAKSNRLADLEPLAPALLNTLSRAMPGSYYAGFSRLPTTESGTLGAAESEQRREPQT
jgi:hypothetical protein